MRTVICRPCPLPRSSDSDFLLFGFQNQLEEMTQNFYERVFQNKIKIQHKDELRRIRGQLMFPYIQVYISNFIHPNTQKGSFENLVNTSKYFETMMIVPSSKSTIEYFEFETEFVFDNGSKSLEKATGTIRGMSMSLDFASE